MTTFLFVVASILIFLFGVFTFIVTTISSNMFDQMNAVHEDVEKYCEELDNEIQ